MKKLDDFTKEELRDYALLGKAKIRRLHEIYGYDKQEMIDYIIKELSKER